MAPRLSGTPQQRERSKRALDVDLGGAVGNAYAERYFPASARTQVQSMVV